MSFFKYSLDGVAEMKSPIRHLIPHIHKSLLVLSAETKQKLIETGVQMEVKYVETDTFVCEVDGKKSVMTLSTRALEVFWTSSYLNAVYFYIVYASGKLGDVGKVHSPNDPLLVKAKDLFNWAREASLGNAESKKEWPTELPQPRPDVPPESWENIADELALSGIAYILLHEAAHVFLKHGPSEASGWSIDQEKDADRQAVEWYFHDCPNPADNKRVRRALGVATVLLSRVASGMFTGKFGGRSHPISWQRLDQVIRLIESDTVHPVFAFLAHLLPLYRSMSGASFSGKPFQDFLDAFDHFIDELSRAFPPPA